MAMSADLFPADPWTYLRRYTTARIALGRAGGSLLTRELLRFEHDHALARDAVQAPFDASALASELQPIAGEVLALSSAAPDRPTYVSRPDLGRRLSPESAARLSALEARPEAFSLVVIVSDGLSALAPQRHAAPLLAALIPRLRELGFTLAPLCCVRHARVAIQDEIGSLLKVPFAAILLGERPGLGVPDSLGAYLVRDPGPGRTDADRNCVSNIHSQGLAPAAAAEHLAALLAASRRLGFSGTRLKLQPQSSQTGLTGG